MKAKGPLGKSLIAGAALMWAGTALSQSTQTLVDQFKNAACPIFNFLTGPFAWAAILLAFVIGVVLLVSGSRRALAVIGISGLGAILMIAGKDWLENMSKNAFRCSTTEHRQMDFTPVVQMEIPRRGIILTLKLEEA